MLLPSAVCLALISNLSFSFGFPFFMRTYPKSIISYNTIPTVRTAPVFPTVTKVQRPRTQSQPSNKVETLMFSDEQYVEQRKIDERDDTSSDATSDLHPIYVLPPPNFQPIVYPTSRSDSALLGAKALSPNGYELKTKIPYEYPQGVSSWIFGGLSGIKRGNYWEQLSPDLALSSPVNAHQPKPVVIYLKKINEPKGQSKWSSFPIYEASSVVKSPTNPTNPINPNPSANKSKPKAKTQTSNKNTINKGLRTKLPVGMTSFFLGGMRGISGRHWQMPDTLVSRVEFMPNDKVLTQKPKKKTKPGVQFDDDNDFYNYNVIIDHK